MADGRAGRAVVAPAGEHRLDCDVRRKAHGAAARSGADGARRRVDAGCDFCALYLRSMVIGFEQRRRLKGVTFDPWPRGSARNGRKAIAARIAIIARTQMISSSVKPSWPPGLPVKSARPACIHLSISKG